VRSIDPFLRCPEVARVSGMSKAQLYRKIREGAFPSPTRIGCISVWRQSTVEAWMADQEAKSREMERDHANLRRPRLRTPSRTGATLAVTN
jgi:prophage regulatory protein